jgi:hypothetical protein
MGLLKMAAHFASSVLPQIKRSLQDVKIPDLLNHLNEVRALRSVVRISSAGPPDDKRFVLATFGDLSQSSR